MQRMPARSFATLYRTTSKAQIWSRKESNSSLTNSSPGVSQSALSFHSAESWAAHQGSERRDHMMGESSRYRSPLVPPGRDIGAKSLGRIACCGRPRRRGVAHVSHDPTPLLLHSVHSCLRRNFPSSSRVQYGMVCRVHVRRFHTSRTAFIVMLCCTERFFDLVPSRPRTSPERWRWPRLHPASLRHLLVNIKGRQERRRVV